MTLLVRSVGLLFCAHWESENNTSVSSRRKWGILVLLQKACYPITPYSMDITLAGARLRDFWRKYSLKWNNASPILGYSGKKLYSLDVCVNDLSFFSHQVAPRSIGSCLHVQFVIISSNRCSLSSPMDTITPAGFYKVWLDRDHVNYIHPYELLCMHPLAFVAINLASYLITMWILVGSPKNFCIYQRFSHCTWVNHTSPVVSLRTKERYFVRWLGSYRMSDWMCHSSFVVK